MRRLAALVVGTATVIIALAGVASADDSGEANTSGPNGTPVIDAKHDQKSPAISAPINSPRAPVSPYGPSGPTCTPTYTPVDPSDVKYIVMANPHLPGTGLPDPNGGEYYWVDGCGYSGKVIFVPNSGPGGPGSPAAAAAVDPAALAVQAEKQLPLPNPHIHMNPDPANSTDQLTELTTWLWIDGGDLATKSDSVTAGPVVVTATATATQVVWDMGDGHTIACTGAGTPYTPGGSPNCSYTYTRSSSSQPREAYKVTATVNWAVSYTVTGAPGGGTLPTITRSSSTAVRVAEQQALNTP